MQSRTQSASIGATRRRAVAVALMLAVAWVSGAAWAGEAPGGAMLYGRYCASCHGKSGRGDGPAAAALTPPPTDLTALHEDVSGLMRKIDGRQAIRAHGTAEMPVWGDVFEGKLIGEPHRRRAALLHVQLIAEYVKSLQGAGTPSPSPR
jgi:mono/diheme cytochrome c family protein